MGKAFDEVVGLATVWWRRVSPRAIRRGRRLVALVAVFGVLLTLGTQQASAFTALEAVRMVKPHGPEQLSGSAAGLSHTTAAAATEVASSGATAAAHKPGKGELSAQSVPAGRGASQQSGVTSRTAQGSRAKVPTLLQQKSASSASQPSSKGSDSTPGSPGRAATGTEITSARTANTTVYQNADGTRTMRVYSRPVHYKKSDGTWGNIDDALVAEGQDGRWSEKANSTPVTFAPSAADPSIVSWTLDATHSVSYGLQGAGDVSAQVKGNVLTYSAAAPSTDVVYDAEAAGIKETLLLHDANAPVTWTFPLHVTGLTPVLNAAGGVDFKDGSGAVRLTIPRGFMEDSSVNPHTGDAAVSSGVTYSLVTVGGSPALQMTLDSVWLHAPGRAFPVRVDPSSQDTNAGASTDVDQSRNVNDSTDSMLRVGAYSGSDGPAGPAKSYLSFPAIGNSVLKNAYVEGVDLNMDDVWAAQCSGGHEIDVRMIDDPWNPATVMTFSDVNDDNGILGKANFDAGSNCSSGSQWETIHLGTTAQSAGSQLVEGWTHGGPNYGLAVTAPSSDSLSWKKFESVNSSYPPYLSISYSPLAADYSVPTSYVMPTSTTTGSQSVTLTNIGSSAWSGNVSLKARLFNASGSEVSTSAPLTKVPGTVSSNASVTMTGTIPAITPGTSYELCWDLYDSSGHSFADYYQVPPSNCTWISAANIAPQIDSMQPLSNQVVNSLSPEIMATGHDPDNWPGTGLTYYFQVFDASGNLLTSSGWISTPTWKVNYGYLAWNATYSWRVEDSDGNNSGAWTNKATFTTQVPQPPVTSHLATPDDGSGHAFDPQVGNYATSATDASVAVAGPSLGVKRSYNSLDPRTNSLFGAGWSTAYDMQVQLDADNSGGVVVTNASGQSERFGRNDFALSQTTSVGDVTGDGIDDIVSVDKTDGGLYLYRGPDYSAATRQGISRGQWVGLASWPTLTWLTGGDIDGDGVGDLLAVNPLNGTLLDWRSLSSTCTTTPIISNSGVNYPFTTYACAPLNISGSTDWRTMSNLAITPPLSGDGLKDLVAVESSTGLLYGYPIKTDGTLGTRVELGTGWNGVHNLVGGTFNGHGGVVGVAASGNVVLYAGKGTGSLGTSVLSPAVNLATDWGSVRDLSAVAGIAGDSGSDLVAVDATTGAQYLYHQAHSFTAGTRTATGMALYVSPAGSGEQLIAQSDGTMLLREKTGTNYTFSHQSLTSSFSTWQLTKITDKEGRTQVLSYTVTGLLTQVEDTTSGRALHFSWNTAGHVALVSTDSSTGTSGPALTWSYSYSASNSNELDQVCAPPTGGNSLASCTTYAYTSGSSSGSHFSTTVLDSAPTAYWRLGDAQGADATDAILANEGAQDGTYSGVTLGTSGGPLPGSPTVVAGFNGTSSQLTVPNRLLATTYVSAGLWFKTTSAGVLLGYASSPLGSASRPTHAVNPLYVGTDGLLRGEFYSTVGSSSPITSGTTVTDGKWHFALLTAAGNTQTLYLDGSAVGTQSAQITPLDMNYVSVGAGYTQATPWPAAPAAGTAGDNHFKGQIAEVAVYQHTLGAPAITAQWQAGSRPSTELDAVTTPLGKSKLAVTYDAVNDRASQVIDANGGTYKLGKPTVSGSTQQYKGAVLASRPSGYWRLGDGAGEQAANEIYADRPTPDNGIYSNVTLGAPGPYEDTSSGEGGPNHCCAASFDGTDSSVELPASNAVQQGPGGISMWFRTTSAGVLFSYQSFPLGTSPSATDQWNPALYVGTDGKVHAQLWTGDSTKTMASTGTVTDGAWHQVALAATSTTSQSLYVDGVLAAGPLTGTITANGTSHVYVGAGATQGGWPNHPTDPDGHFNGQISNVAVFANGKVPAASEAGINSYDLASAVYDAMVLDAHPTGYWPLADTSGNQASEVLSSTALAQNQGTATNIGSDTGPWASGSTPADSFDGTDSSIALPGSMGVKAAPASVEVWFKTTSAGVLYANQTFPLGSSSNGTTDRWNPTLYVGSDGNLHGQFFTGTAAPATSSTTVTDGKWHLADLVASGSTQQLYLDGVPTGTPITGTIRYNGQGYTYLGAGNTTSWPSAPSDTDGHLNGSLADFSTYSYALNANTIAGHYTAATVPAPGTGMDASSAYRAEVVQAGPSDYWRLDEGQGQKVQDELGTALPDPYAGTYSNVTLNTAGPSGNSDENGVTFNGTSSAVQLPSTAAPVTGPASVELWFKTSKAGVLYSYQSGALGDAQTNWNPALYVGTDNKLHGLFLDTAGSASDQLISTGTVTDNKWHQAVLAATTTSETLYLDGAQVGTESKGTLFFNGGAYVYLGAGATSSAWPAAPADDATGTNYFTGSLAEFAYYPSTLDTATVASHFQAMSSSANPTPVTTVKVTDPGNSTLSYSYDTDNGGRIIAKRDAYGNSTRYGYDTSGFLDTVIDADGHTTSTGHDTHGNPVSTTTCTNPSTCNTSYATYYLNYLNALDPRNDEVTSTSDARSTSAADPTYQTNYQYDSTGNLTSTTRPDATSSGRTYTLTTTPATGGGTAPPGLLASSTDYKKNTTTYKYFSNGDLASATTPSGQVTTYTYDNLGRVLSKTVSCTNCGTGQSSMVTQYAWDGQSNLLTQTDPATTDAVTGVTHTQQTSYTYDLDGYETGQTFSDLTGGDASRSNSWVYLSNRDQVSKVTDPLGRSTSYGYDAYGNVTSQTDPSGVQYAYIYSPMGQLQQTAIRNYTGDPNHPVSSRWQVLDSRAYDPAGRLATDTDAMGRTTHTYYYDDNTVAEIDLDGYHNADGTLRNVVERTDVYDAAGNVTEETTGGGRTTTTSTYDVNGHLASSTLDPSGLNRTTNYTYDANGNVTAQLQSGGGLSQEIDSTYNSLDDTTSTTVRDGSGNHTATVQYDQRGLPISSVSADGNAPGATAASYTSYYTYDAAGQLTTSIAPPVTTEVYNPTTNTPTVQQVAPITTTGYDTYGDVTSVKDPQSALTAAGSQDRITTTTFDKDGEPVAVATSPYTDPHTGTTIHPTATMAYDPLGRLSSTTSDPSGLNLTTSRSYDQLGNLTTLTPPALGGASTTSTYSYDLDGEQLSETGPTGAVTEATYDDLGNQITGTVIERTPTPQALTTQYTWDDAGNQLTSTQPGGGIASAAYDAAGEPTSTTDAAQHTTKTAYDALGRTTSVTNPDGTKSTWTYNAFGQPLTASELDTTGAVARTSYTSYDPAGNTLTSTAPVATAADAPAHTTTFTLDALGRITKQVEPGSTNTPNITSTFGYDADGNQTRFTDGNSHTTYTTYNSLGLAESTIEPPTTAYPNPADGTFTTSYDALGRAVTRTEPGGVVRQSSYDSLGDLTHETATGGEGPTGERILGYDPAGNLTSVGTPNSGTDSYRYDDRGDLVQSTGPSGNSSYTYDADGNMASRTDAAGTTSFTYNTNDQLTTTADPLTGSTVSYGYDAAGRLQNEQYGTGGGRSYTYDTLSRLSTDTVKNPSGTAMSSISYQYNAADQVTGKTTTGTAGATSNTYGYDPAGRLTSWNNGTTTTNYNWDAAGNRTSEGTQTATYDARNELLTNGTTTYSYTARGTLNDINLQGGSNSTVQYDGFDRMTAEGPVTYTYDSLDRIATTAGTTFTYDGGSNNLVTDALSVYSRLPDGSLFADANLTGAPTSSARIAITDQHSDVVASLDPTSHTLTGSTAYDPFGQPTASTGTSSSLGYQSGWTDPTTGQVNMNARWYQPGSGTFTSRDSWNLSPNPSAIEGNRYTYGVGDPLGNIDPSGHLRSHSACVALGYLSMVNPWVIAGCEWLLNSGSGSLPGDDGSTDLTGETKACITSPWLTECGGDGVDPADQNQMRRGSSQNYGAGSGNSDHGGGGNQGGGGGGGNGGYSAPGPARPVIDPTPKNKRPHIKTGHGDSNWITNAIVQAGKGILGGAAAEAVSFIPTALTGIEGLVETGTGALADLVGDLTSDDPSPEPQPDPIRPGPVPLDLQRNSNTCLDHRPTGAVSNGAGWSVYGQLDPVTGRSTGAGACLFGDPGEGSGPNGKSIAGYDKAKKKANASMGEDGDWVSRCHLLDQALGGLGIAQNLAPCWQYPVNTGRGGMQDIQDRVFAELDEGRVVEVSNQLKYNRNISVVPYQFDYVVETYNFDGSDRREYDYPIQNCRNIGPNCVYLGN